MDVLKQLACTGRLGTISTEVTLQRWLSTGANEQSTPVPDATGDPSPGQCRCAVGGGIDDLSPPARPRVTSVTDSVTTSVTSVTMSPMSPMSVTSVTNVTSVTDVTSVSSVTNATASPVATNATEVA
ncbi:unnamed protein product, partial [Iphiclides podalirius]